MERDEYIITKKATKSVCNLCQRLIVVAILNFVQAFLEVDK